MKTYGIRIIKVVHAHTLERVKSSQSLLISFVTYVLYGEAYMMDVLHVIDWIPGDV
jgi:hypothetical protein